MIYLDTSAIVKLYFKEDRSREIAAWLETNNQAIPLTRFHELELVNAVQLKFFRGEIVAEEIELVLAKLDDHERRGVYFRPQIEWSEVLETAMDLSKRFYRLFGFKIVGYPSCGGGSMHGVRKISEPGYKTNPIG